MYSNGSAIAFLALNDKSREIYIPLQHPPISVGKIQVPAIRLANPPNLPLDPLVIVLIDSRSNRATPIAIAAFEWASTVGLNNRPCVFAFLEHAFQEWRRDLGQVADSRLCHSGH